MDLLKWNIDHFRCTQCKRELIPSNVDAASGTVDEVSITLRHLPCLACPVQHEKWPAHPDFPEGLLDALFKEGVIPTSNHKGLLRKKLLCPICNSELAKPVRCSRFEVSLRLLLPGSKYEVEFVREEVRQIPVGDPAVFFLELICPALTCTKCGVPIALFGAGVTSPVRRALVEAMDSHLKGMR